MAVVREVDFKDVDGVGQLARAIGWSVPTRQSWERLWLDNPALDGDRARLSKGWVLEEDGKLVGFLANLTQRYHFQGRILRAAVAAGLVVAPDFRGNSMRLMLSFAKQTAVDLLLNTTAAPHVTKLFQFLKFQSLPQPDYGRSFYWVLRETAFLNAGLRKKGFSQFISRVGSLALAPALWAEVTLRRRYRRPRSGRLDIRILGPEQIDGDFDALWERKRSEGGKLLADRTARTLRWHYAAEGRPNPPFLVAAYDGHRLVGYLGVVRQDAPHIELRRARVADLFVERDDPEVIRALVGAAMRHARAEGADMLEAIGYPESVRRSLAGCRPFELREDTTPFLYRALDPELHQALSVPDVWYASLYDGDGSL